MSERFHDTLDEADLHLWVDGRMTPEQLQAFEHRLRQSESMWAQAQAWRLQRQQLKGLHISVLDEEPPSYLAHWARKTERHAQTQTKWFKLGGMAASWCVALGLGWALGQPNNDHGFTQFAKQATMAHAVFQPEQRHPVEVTADQEPHLVQWLSNRLGQPLVVANLTPAGFDLLGGRLLPGDSGPRAQLMYQHDNGSRITIYVGIVNPASNPNTTMQLYADGTVSTLYWVANGKAIALSGQLPPNDLKGLAQYIYTQMINMQPI